MLQRILEPVGGRFRRIAGGIAARFSMEKTFSMRVVLSTPHVCGRRGEGRQCPSIAKGIVSRICVSGVVCN